MTNQNGRFPRDSKNSRGSRRNKQEEEPKRPRIERVVVSTLNYHKNLKSTLDFEWPEFTKELDRIKANTKRADGKSIPEVFGVQVDLNKAEHYDTLRELRVGDSIDVTVLDISDNNVTFQTVATKQIIQSSINLKKYAKFKASVPFKTTAIVTRTDRETAYIDIVKPVYEEWLGKLLLDPDQQRNIHSPRTVKVHNLKLTRGGFIGQAEIPVVSEFVGQPYTVEAFIPGSQIVLNIEDNFDKWVGQTVEAFIASYMKKPGTRNEMSLVCSRKDLLKFCGDNNTVKMFSQYCDNDEAWKNLTSRKYTGVVTGIINSSKKCGVFVEIPELFITGMVDVDADKLVNYKPKDQVKVKVCGFEENTYYDQVTGQVRHDVPFEIENDVLKSCYVKPIFKFV